MYSQDISFIWWPVATLRWKSTASLLPDTHCPFGNFLLGYTLYILIHSTPKESITTLKWFAWNLKSCACEYASYSHLKYTCYVWGKNSNNKLLDSNLTNIIGQNVLKLLIFAVSVSYIASILKTTRKIHTPASGVTFNLASPCWIIMKDKPCIWCTILVELMGKSYHISWCVFLVRLNWLYVS